ncbi:MAG: glycosyltransferase family 2 protein [Anaerolineae bacterium]|nr:glycosyltransferase family 2 protein [Anaerolineae bacterium]
MGDQEQNKPLVYIVILNWNNAPDTVECLSSLLALDYPNYHTLVVDNGSTDNSVSKIKASQPSVEILETGSNLGYAEGNNVGIRQAIEAGAQYVLVLNNDTLVDPSMVTELVNFAETHPEAGMVGPLMYCEDPRNILFATGSFIQWAQGKTWHRDMFQPAKPHSNLGKPEKVDFITGCGVLVRRELIETAGVLNSEYYLNFEDVEWCVRARRNGFEVWYVPQAILWHKVSASLGQSSPANTYYMTRNALLFFGQNAPINVRWLSILRIIMRTLRAIGAWSILTTYKNEQFRRLRQANLLALRDFLLGRFGQMGADVTAVCYPVK